MDEPFAAVDATSRSMFKARLKAALADIDPTVVMISHDFSDFLDLTDQTAVVLNGRIVEQGPTAALLKHVSTGETLFPTLNRPVNRMTISIACFFLPYSL
ncbi:MAG: hypothetical protein IMX04_00090 [Candidatus Carbobacillus altaicus]|nr:hypothetical protein [Candidatus Carbobacillus altaicus]